MHRQIRMDLSILICLKKKNSGKLDIRKRNAISTVVSVFPRDKETVMQEMKETWQHNDSGLNFEKMNV